MNKNIIKLSLLNLRKKTIIYSIFIVSLSIISIFFINSYIKTYNNYLNSSMYENNYFKSLVVGKENESNAKIMSDLKSMEYVLNVSHIYSHQLALTSNFFKTDKANGDIWVFNSNNKTLPKVINGTNFPDDENYYMICPENFYPSISEENIYNLNIKEKIDLSKYLNKDIPFYYSGLSVDPNTLKPMHTYDINIKLIGLYKNSDYNIDEYICYVNNKTIEDIAFNQYSGQEEKLELQEGFVVEIDSPNHIAEFERKLEEEGYTYTPMAYVDPNIFHQISRNALIISTVISIFTFAIIFLIFLKDLNDDKNNNVLLNYLGYPKNDIKKLFLISNFFKIFISIIVGIIFLIIAATIFFVILKYYPYIMYKRKIIFDFVSILYIILLLLMAVLIASFIGFKKFRK